MAKLKTLDKEKLYTIIFEADTKAGRLFDIVLIWSIVLSVLIVILESMNTSNPSLRIFFAIGEWFFTLLFTVEYILRIYVVRKKLSYITSFFGVIDLLAILPTFVSLLIPGIHYLINIRILRLLRVFRVLKLSRFITEGELLSLAIKSSIQKIIIFFFILAFVVTIMGSILYVIEGPKHGFTDIPTGIYWAIITITTVGYGDISPQTGLGKLFASMVMIIGYSIIAVPTGIFAAEFSRYKERAIHTTQVCPNCLREGHDFDATHCKHCGERLNA